MNRIITFGLSVALSMIFVGPAFTSYSVQQNSFWVQICGSGLLVNLEIGGDQDEPQPAHKLQACHAICSKDEQGNGAG